MIGAGICGGIASGGKVALVLAEGAANSRRRTVSNGHSGGKTREIRHNPEEPFHHKLLSS